MIRYKLPVITLLSFLLILEMTFALDMNKNSVNQMIIPESSGEKITLITERTLYIIDEKVNFSATYYKHQDYAEYSWSKVLYIELINNEGKSFLHEKYKLSNDGSNGYFVIPKNILSGIYYVKAYTQWMRNYSSRDYAYLPIKIINPFNNETETTYIEHSDTFKIKTFHTNNFIVNCTTDKKKYSKRDKIKLVLNSKQVLDNQNIFMTASLLGAVCSNLTSEVLNKPIENKPLKKLKYLPEKRGISLSGKIINKNTGEPLIENFISLSLLNHKSYFTEFMTDKDGDFIFTFPELEKSHDLYLNLASSKTLDTEFLINSDFCSEPITLKKRNFSLTPEEKYCVRKLMINKQIQDRFLPKKDLAQDNSTKITRHSFYGKPDHTYFTKDYIELPNLEEFFFELIPEVYVLYKKHIPYLKLKNETGLSFLEPLILVDNIPIDDQVMFLHIPLNKIERVEIIEKGYAVGNRKYNGVINTFSKKGDFAGIELPKTSMFINYQMITPQDYYQETEIEKNRIQNRAPYTKNCLFWEPKIEFNSKNEASFSFYSGDTSGEYEVVIRRLNPDGSIDIIGRSMFFVE